MNRKTEYAKILPKLIYRLCCNSTQILNKDPQNEIHTPMKRAHMEEMELLFNWDRMNFSINFVKKIIFPYIRKSESLLFVIL